MLSVSTGHHWRYLTDAVGKGRENYYTQATSQGEPPGVWNGAGAAKLGLSGEVTENQMSALYGNFVDPRDPSFSVPEGWETASKLGQPPRNFRSKDDILKAMMAREPNATPERIEQLKAQASKDARQAVSFIDLTFSPAKSVSVLHTAFRAQEAAADRAGDAKQAAMWRERAEAVEAAMWDANTAMLDYMQREAGFSRVGYHGRKNVRSESVGRYVDAHDWTVASFFQHTSRPVAGRGEQPQLHIHNAVLNRVECPDGTFRTLDSKGIHKVRGAGGAFADRVLFESLTKRLGVNVSMRPDGKSREIVGIPKEVNEWFSARRQAITKRTQAYVDVFRDRYGREPNNLELARLATKATLKTRGGKLKDATTPKERVERWADEVRNEVNTTLGKCARDTLKQHDPDAASVTFRPAEVIENALAEVQQSKSEWTRYDLLRAIDKHLPDSLGGAEAADIERVREQLADRALQPARERVGKPDEVWRLSAPELVEPPAELRREDGASMYRPHGSDRYATRAQLSAERQLEKAAQQDRGSIAISDKHAAKLLGEVNERLSKTGGKLGDDQAAALHGVLTSGRPVEALMGPPGTGKSFTLGTLSELWEDRLGNGRVFGLALAQNAAGVLADEGLKRAENVTRWLAMQKAIDARKASAGDTAKWQLKAGDLVVVDESSMADTTALAEVQHRANSVGAKVLFVGDSRQLSAVGSGGAFVLVSEAGVTYELSEVRRFHAEWEREASLRLRAGDTSVLPIYERHGRLMDGGSIDDAREMVARAWLADTLAGRPSVMVVDTNDDAAELSRQAQQQMVNLGRVQRPIMKLADGNSAGVGDLIQARRNDRTIRTKDGEWVVNRHNYRITGIDPKTGAVTGRRILDADRNGEQLGDEVRLPAEYLREHTALGYAVTAHGVQGATLGDRETVGTSHQIVTRRTGADAYLVGQTRGTGANIAYVVTRDEPDWRTPDDVAEAEEEAARRGDNAEAPTPVAIVSDLMERYEPDGSALERMRQELADAESIHTNGAIWTDVQEQITEPRYEQIIRELLPADQADAVMADDARSPLWRVVRGAELAGHHPREVLGAVIAQREVDSADSIAQVLHWRVCRSYDLAAAPQQDTYIERTIREDGPLPAFALELAEAMEERVKVLGEQTADEAPAWAVRHLGAVPEDPIDRASWAARAGRVAAYREQYHYTDADDAIGRVPRTGQPEARAGWYAAWRALGQPDDRPDEAMMTDAQLREVIARYDREVEWSPSWVGDELRHASETARLMREQAYLTRVEAQQETDPERARKLHREAAEWTALARDAAGDRNHYDYVDAARSQWYIETAGAREANDRAREELASRGRIPESEMTPKQAAQHAYLSELSNAGVLTEDQRDRIFADAAAPAMWKALDDARESGLAVDGPDGMFAGVIKQRKLETDPNSPAESLAQVLHWRVTTTVDDPKRAQQWRDKAATADVDQNTGPASDTHAVAAAADDGLWWPDDLAQMEPPPLDDEIEPATEPVAEPEPVTVAEPAVAEADWAPAPRQEAEPAVAPEPVAETDPVVDAARGQEPAPAEPERLADKVERARQAREIIEARVAERAREAAEIENRQRRTADIEAEAAAQRERDREGPSLSL